MPRVSVCAIWPRPSAPAHGRVNLPLAPAMWNLVRGKSFRRTSCATSASRQAGMESNVTQYDGFNLIVIGDRINPGFKAVKVLVDNNDFAGIQALAVRQVEAGASYLDITIGPRAAHDSVFMADTIRAIQAVT